MENILRELMPQPIPKGLNLNNPGWNPIAVRLKFVYNGYLGD